MLKKLDALIEHGVPGDIVHKSGTEWLFEDPLRSSLICIFASYLKEQLFVKGEGVPVSWVLKEIYWDYLSGHEIYREESLLEKIKTCFGRGFVVQTFGKSYSTSLKDINCGVISLSEDCRYLSWKPFFG